MTVLKEKFKITFIGFKEEDSSVQIKEFEDTFNPHITAMEWAEDYAYSISDKGSYVIEKIKD